MQNFRRTLVALSCLIVGAASFALSFVALRDVSIELMAVDPSLAFLVPVVIDGGIIGGSAVIWSYSQEQARRPVFPFLFVASLVIISVIVNASHAGPAPLAKIIAALPPLVLLGVLELVAAQHRRVHATTTANQPTVSRNRRVRTDNRLLDATAPKESYTKTESGLVTENPEPFDHANTEHIVKEKVDSQPLDSKRNSDMFADLDSELESLASYAGDGKKPTARKQLRVKAQEPGV